MKTLSGSHLGGEVGMLKRVGSLKISHRQRMFRHHQAPTKSFRQNNLEATLFTRFTYEVTFLLFYDDVLHNIERSNLMRSHFSRLRFFRYPLSRLFMP